MRPSSCLRRRPSSPRPRARPSSSPPGSSPLGPRVARATTRRAALPVPRQRRRPPAAPSRRPTRNPMRRLLGAALAASRPLLCSRIAAVAGASALLLFLLLLPFGFAPHRVEPCPLGQGPSRTDGGGWGSSVVVAVVGRLVGGPRACGRRFPGVLASRPPRPIDVGLRARRRAGREFGFVYRVGRVGSPLLLVGGRHYSSLVLNRRYISLSWS